MMAPDWRTINPYLELLAESLEQRGLTVLFPVGYRRLLPLFRGVRNVAATPDVVHLHWHNAYIRSSSLIGQLAYSVKFLADVAAVRLSGIRIIWTIHNETPHDSGYPSLFRTLQRCLAFLSHGIIVHTRSALEILRAQLGSQVTKVRIIPHGSYLKVYGPRLPRSEARQAIAASQDTKIFLYFGVLCPYKGVEDLLSAWRQQAPRPARSS